MISEFPEIQVYRHWRVRLRARKLTARADATATLLQAADLWVEFGRAVVAVIEELGVLAWLSQILAGEAVKPWTSVGRHAVAVATESTIGYIERGRHDLQAVIEGDFDPGLPKPLWHMYARHDAITAEFAAVG